MKKIHKNAAEKQAAYLQRKREKEEIAAEAADVDAQYKALNLCGFAETACDAPAQTCLEEIQVHRSWLRALEQSDIKEGETLRALARRTWNALLSSEGLGVVTDGGGKWIEGKWVRGFDVWYPCFQPSKQHFQIPFDSTQFPGGPLGEGFRGAAKPEWFDKYWQPPSDCTGDEPIRTEDLPPLPPVKFKRAA